jgi:putative peptidoglycan lipid II flippase
MENKTLAKHAWKTAFGTALSRIFGYIRDMLVASLFGTGMFSDAFYAAFRIPNFFRRIFGEGSFSAAFIPVFSEYLHTKEKSEVQEFLNVIFAILILVLIIISVLGIFFSSFLVKIVACGFSNAPEKIQLATELTRLMFPFVLFISLAALLLAILNTLDSFFVPAFAPISLSFSEIFYILAIAPVIISKNQIKGLAISVIIGGALHFFVQYPKLKSLGWNLKFKFDLKHPAVRKIVFLMIPSIVGLSADQINALIDSRCASSLGQGPVSALYYSNRLMQMPLAIFGIAFASASFPAMSKAYAQGDITALKGYLSYSIRFTVFSLLPAATGLMVVGLPIVKFLFEHGKFTSLSSVMTNSALFYYALGLPAYALSKIFANTFYSFQNTKIPVIAAISSMLLHVILCIVLMHLIGVGGLALATALSSYFNFILLAVYLKKCIGRLGFKQILFSFLKSSIASIVTGIVAWNMCKVSKILILAVPISIFSGLIGFIVVACILRCEELKIIKHIFFKKLK